MTQPNDPNAPRRDFVVPPLRQFSIVRPTLDDPDQIETITVSAHVVQYTGKGRVLVFLDYIIDPVIGPTTRLHRIVPNYLDFAEINVPATDSDSRIIH